MAESAADAAVGVKYLRRLEVFLDVVYALLFVEMLQYLPMAEDMSWVGSPLGLLQVLVDNPDELLRIFIGLGLTLIYWNHNNRLLGPLVRTDGRHALLALLQMVFVCLFLYFAISDPRLAGGPSSPALQALSLAIAGFFGIAGWRHARKNGLVSDAFSEEDRDRIGRNGLIEPITSLINTPVAFIGPMVWTIGWFTIPLVVIRVVVKRKKK